MNELLWLLQDQVGLKEDLALTVAEYGHNLAPIIDDNQCLMVRHKLLLANLEQCFLIRI